MKTLRTQKKYSHTIAHYLQSFWFGILPLLLAFQLSWAQSYTPLYDNGSFNSRMLRVDLAVGATAGEAGVSPVGGGTYTIPIVAPPGTNGVTPSVALTYNSMGGNGLVGMGWSISGLSMISRVPRSIYQDGATGSVELNADDRFALDGVRLVATSGTYGANLATYATESETFAKITSYDLPGSVAGTGWFKVEAKDGTVLEYGTDADTRRQFDSSHPTVFWLLKKIKYPDGNYIEFNYTLTTLDYKIDEINYTGNSNTGLAPYNKIKFEYTSRSDANVVYEAGLFMHTDNLLDKITVTAEGQTVRTYQLNYGFDNINSYLKQITEKGSDGSELNATIFKYGDVPTDFTLDSPSLNLSNLVKVSSGDFDADGYTDILETTIAYTTGGIEYSTGFNVYKRTSSSPTYTQVCSQPFTNTFQVVNKISVPNFYSFLANDFTGDGADDVAVANVTISGSDRTITDWKIYQSNNATSFTPITIPIYPNYTQVHSSGNFVFPGDFNGDGIQDLLSILGWNNSYAAHLYFGGNTSFGTVVPSNINFNNWAASDKIYVLDFNGDSKSDLMLITNNTCEIYTFEGYIARQLYTGSFPTKNHLIYLGDFNGDRKTDLLVRASLTDNTAAWSKAISTGKGFSTGSFPFQKQPDIVGSYPVDHLTIADYNGDGKTDIYHAWSYYNGTQYVSDLDLYYSRGTNFYYLKHTAFTLLGFGDSQPFDLNGDGRSDLMNRSYFTSSFNFFSFRKDGKEHLLEKVANGHGHVTEWNYKRLNEAGSFYSQNGLGTAPFNNIQLPMYAVSDFKSQNGIGGISTIQYAYEEARIHKKGKGFLGFKKTTASNLTMNTKMVVETQFNSYPLATAIIKTGTYLLPNTLLNETTFTNEFVAYGSSEFDPNKRYWQRVTGTNENNAFEGRTVATSSTYDDYGNVTTGTVNNNNGLEITTTTAIYGTYVVSISNKPTSVTVSRTRSGQSAYSVTTAYAYNGIGQLTSKTDFSGQSQSVTTNYGYNSLGNLTQTTVNLSGMTARTTSSTYDTKGRYALSTTNPLSQTTTATYDPKWGKPLSVQGIDGLTTTYEYDVFGRTKKTHFPEGYTLTQSYGWDIGNGAIYYTLLDHPGKPNVKTWYDVLGREIKSETQGFNNETITQTKTYDTKGNTATTTQPYKASETALTTTTTYDVYNRPTSITTSQGSFGTTTIGYAYNAGNLTTTTTNPAGQVSSKTTDATGQTISATDHGGTLTYTYNSQGNLLTVVKDGVTLTSSQYDAYGRQTQLTDQNAGTTTYAYDALGQLTSQTNANGNLTTMAYDVVGRITTRSGVEGTTTHEYFANSNGAATGQLKKITSFAGNTEEYTYDSYGRLSATTETVDGTAHATSYSYNMYGDVTAKNFPSGFGTTHVYDGNGYLTHIRNANSSVTLYTNNGLSGLGVNTNYTLGNGKTSTVNHFFGIPTQYSTAEVQDLLLTWNYASGNLTQRKDNLKGREENFTYDNLNRLSSAQVVGQAALTMNYGNIGNIDFKTDAGAYTYHPTKPNAVTFVTNPQSVVPSLRQHISYTAFAQPAGLVENNYALTYTYGSDYNRLRAITQQNGSEINRRYYFGDYEKDITGGTTKHLHYISSPAGLVAIVVRENGSDTYYYTYTDHLGSILTVTYDNGTVVGEQSFDAWGRYRDPGTWVPLTTPPSGVGGLGWLTRGYTGHEHLRPFALINMNGRLYDPALGRVLSADNYVQDPFFSQNYNRYSYAYNNPLSNNDPTGNLVFFIIPQISYSQKGGLSIGLEFGIGVPGVLSASITGGYNFGSGQGYWSMQGYAAGFYAGYGSSGGFAGWGYRYGGFSGGVSYGREGLGIGIGLGATANNFNGALGIGWNQTSGFDWNISGGYTHIIDKPIYRQIAEYNLENAPTEPMKQKGGFDCLICAATYIDQIAQGRTYDQIMGEFAQLYNPETGTNTKAALDKLYGEENVKSFPEFSPIRDLKKGSFAIIAKDRNHAIVPTHVSQYIVYLKHWKMYNFFNTRFTFRTTNSYSVFNIRYMDPAIGKFQYTGKVRSYKFPTYKVTPR